VHYATNAARLLPEEATVRFVIDAKRSTLTVQAFSTGLLSAFGHNPKIAVRGIEGDAQFVADGATLKDARAHVNIRADTLEVIDDISEKDRREIRRQMYDEVLEIDRFPEILYECSKATASGGGDRYWVVLQGELTLHGVTRALPVSARVVITGDSLRASGEFSVRQSDYEIAFVKVAGGAIKLKDEVKCTFDIMGRKPE
jgi:polyisoprenoid-binding protein YceI